MKHHHSVLIRLVLREFTLSRKDPEYVGRAKKVRAAEEAREDGKCPCQADDEVAAAFNEIHKLFPDVKASETEIGSVIYAVKPGDGSAREQAASCQRVLGGLANIAQEYATKRYRSNLINWGMIPFIFEPEKLHLQIWIIFLCQVFAMLLRKSSRR